MSIVSNCVVVASIVVLAEPRAFFSREADSSTHFPCVAVTRLRSNDNGCRMITLSRRMSQGLFSTAGPAARVRVRVMRS